MVAIDIGLNTGKLADYVQFCYLNMLCFRVHIYFDSM